MADAPEDPAVARSQRGAERMLADPHLRELLSSDPGGDMSEVTSKERFAEWAAHRSHTGG